MAKTHPLQAVSLDFFHSARWRIEKQLTLSCSTERVMAAMADNSQWQVWAGPIKSAEWLSPPGAPGCRRKVYLAGGVVFDETFFHWVDGEGAAFAITAATIPILNRFAEWHELQPRNDGKLDLSFRLAFELRGAARLLSPLLYLVFQAAVPSMLKRYQHMLENS